MTRLSERKWMNVHHQNHLLFVYFFFQLHKMMTFLPIHQIESSMQIQMCDDERDVIETDYSQWSTQSYVTQKCSFVFVSKSTKCPCQIDKWSVNESSQPLTREFSNSFDFHYRPRNTFPIRLFVECLSDVSATFAIHTHTSATIQMGNKTIKFASFMRLFLLLFNPNIFLVWCVIRNVNLKKKQIYANSHA